MKIVSGGDRQFMTGWTACSHCGKRMKYFLEVTIGITMLDEYELCKTCLWEFSGLPNESSWPDKIIMLKVIQ